MGACATDDRQALLTQPSAPVSAAEADSAQAMGVVTRAGIDRSQPFDVRRVTLDRPALFAGREALAAVGAASATDSGETDAFIIAAGRREDGQEVVRLEAAMDASSLAGEVGLQIVGGTAYALTETGEEIMPGWLTRSRDTTSQMRTGTFAASQGRASPRRASGMRSLREHLSDGREVVGIRAPMPGLVGPGAGKERELALRLVPMASGEHPSAVTRTASITDCAAALIWDETCGGRPWSPPALPPTPAPPPADCRAGIGAVLPGSELSPRSFGVDLVLQHGIMSSGETWCAFYPQLRNDFDFDRAHLWDTNWKWAHKSQVEQVEQRVAAERPDGGLIWLAGHSQGGLIARGLGQQIQARDLGRTGASGVRGVVTMDSPNVGAPIATALQDAARVNLVLDVLRSWEFPIDGCSMLGCFSIPFLHPVRDPFVALLQIAGFDLVAGAAGNVLPFARDNAMGSTSLQSLNSTPEPYLRASVSSTIPPRWALYQTIGDSFGAKIGYRWQQYANRVWFSLVIMAAVCQMEEEMSDAWSLDYLSFFCFRGAPYYYTYGFAGMIALNDLWAFATGTAGGGDGFIPTFSQEYPYSSPGSQNVGRYRCDYRLDGLATCASHSANTHSRRSYEDFREGLIHVGLLRRLGR